MIYNSTFKIQWPGFSFIEIMVVLVMMSALLAISIPQFDSLFEKPHQAELKHLTSVLKLLRNEAILGHTEFFIIFDTKEQQFHVEKQSRSGVREKLESPKALRPHLFSEDLPLKKVSLAQNINVDTTSVALELPIEITIDSSGFVTPFTLVFEDPEVANQFWHIKTKDIMGRLELKEQQRGFF